MKPELARGIPKTVLMETTMNMMQSLSAVEAIEDLIRQGELTGDDLKLIYESANLRDREHLLEAYDELTDAYVTFLKDFCNQEQVSGLQQDMEVLKEAFKYKIRCIVSEQT